VRLGSSDEEPQWQTDSFCQMSPYCSGPHWSRAVCVCVCVFGLSSDEGGPLACRQSAGRRRQNTRLYAHEPLATRHQLLLLRLAQVNRWSHFFKTLNTFSTASVFCGHTIQTFHVVFSSNMKSVNTFPQCLYFLNRQAITPNKIMDCFCIISGC